MADLFVSYKSEDRPRVAPLVAALEADGVSIWWDAHIGGGSEWRETIETELNAGRCVLVVWSERSVGREGSFVRDEATRALRRGAYLPVRIDPVEPPLGFGETQALSLIGWKGDRADAHYQALLGAVRAVVAGEPRPIPPAFKPQAAVDRRLLFAGGGALAAAAVIGGGAWWATHQRAAAAGDSVAVLPFENLSGDPAQAYFSDGIAEELRDALTRIDQLKVAARTSSELMRNADAQVAAAKLGVANILTGTVRRGADTLRISASLVDGKTGLTHWSQTYDRAIGDALAIQTGIAESVAGALKIALGHAEKALLTLGGTNNPVAQDAYLRGRALSRQGKSADALTQYNAAVAADPNFATALTGRAVLIAGAAAENLGGAALRVKLDEAEAEVRRAVTLAPGLGGPLAALGNVLTERLELRDAKAALMAAVKASPGDASVLRQMGAFEANTGDDNGLELYRRAQSLDPLRAATLVDLTVSLFYLGRVDEAITMGRSALARLPGNAHAQTFLALALLAKGEVREALKVAELLAEDDGYRMLVEAVAYAVTDRSTSDRALSKLEQTGNSWYQVAEARTQRKEPDLAFAALTRAWELADPGMPQMKKDSLLAPLRLDPRFATWIEKIGYP